ncbi:DUF7126 family protein [Salinibaculum rarum]|uniref:DUF7126 family protein n=1 Tax=Salinibaculum rarum TaxID=3058903 RepID=UPI00265E3E4F|nr:CTP synthetase [Salinibaculum sp. KK48]
MNVIVAGTDDHDIAAAIESEGHSVSRVDIANRPALEEAGTHDASVLVLTEVEQATAIAVAKDLNEDLKVVFYSEGSLPDFASRQADMLVDPALLDADAVAEELDS